MEPTSLLLDPYLRSRAAELQADGDRNRIARPLLRARRQRRSALLALSSAVKQRLTRLGGQDAGRRLSLSNGEEAACCA